MPHEKSLFQSRFSEEVCDEAVGGDQRTISITHLWLPVLRYVASNEEGLSITNATVVQRKEQGASIPMMRVRLLPVAPGKAQPAGDNG